MQKQVTYDPTNKKAIERVCHALAFECIATLICAPLFAYLMNTPILQMGALTIMVATVAMLWNFTYNILFDKAQRKFQFTKTPRVRVLHAILFEAGLILVSVPLAAWWLSTNLVAAFVLEIGMLLFFLPYTVVYNWIYDSLRKSIWMRKHKI